MGRAGESIDEGIWSSLRDGGPRSRKAGDQRQLSPRDRCSHNEKHHEKLATAIGMSSTTSQGTVKDNKHTCVYIRKWISAGSEHILEV